ncbi:TlpA disulfide reductase family protein [Acuticoccus sp. MNP-M23]|uniref:TlpA disulfide reductase family protein n=1 Tax=Acuticoccus sp. MNP-M23 TaxID=3072793 RepID=UPI002815D4CC|nr:TlpA disulfide reductase family protein [Acuticoccus sp. MNP-M23]WMS41027.1 TlpA disulfide reductase family protein [Acuticoccus sp. MNP-M23]
MAARTWIIGGAAAVGVMVFTAAVLITAGGNIFSLAKGTSQCRAAAEMAGAVKPLVKGEMAAFLPLAPADLSALPFDGTGADATTIETLKGKTTLLNLWATWCAPCRIEMPHLAALETARGGDDFAVVATSIDHNDNGRPTEFLAETGAENLAYHREPDLTLFNSLKKAGLAMGMPTTLLIAPDGCAAGVLHGAAVWNSPDSLALIDAAVASTR